MATAVTKISSHIKADGTAQIYILVTSGKKRKKISVGYSVRPEHFSVDTGMVISKEPNFRSINAQINRILGEHQAKIEVSKLTGASFVLDERKLKVTSFYDFCKEELDRQHGRAEGTMRHYKVWIGRLQRFDAQTKVSDINGEWVNKFKSYLHKSGGVNNTPIGKAALHNAFKVLKKMVKAGIRDGHIAHNVFAHVDLPKEQKRTKIKYLTPAEMELFESEAHKQGNEHFKRCTLWQIYGSYCGLRISDWYKSDLRQYLKDEVIILKQTKTSGEVEIPLYPKLEKAIKDLLDFGLPPLSEHQHNLTLKSFAQVAKINHDMTSHFARHTFAVYLAEKDVPPGAARKFLGHKNIKETMVYYELVSTKLSDVAKKYLQ